jgi:hypothetical protein
MKRAYHGAPGGNEAMNGANQRTPGANHVMNGANPRASGANHAMNGAIYLVNGANYRPPTTNHPPPHARQPRFSRPHPRNLARGRYYWGCESSVGRGDTERGRWDGQGASTAGAAGRGSGSAHFGFCGEGGFEPGAVFYGFDDGVLHGGGEEEGVAGG